MLDAPPYSVTSSNTLRVRPDLFAALTFQEVGRASAQATVRGFGRVAFAPNSAYAVRASVAGFVERVHVIVGQEVQAGQALATAERAAGRRSASRSFRRTFLLGYAGRIGERLTSARERATREAAAEQGVDLLPVLRSRQEAVDDAFTELFPRVRSTRSRASMDAGGWWAGRAAADSADVGSRHSSLR